MNFDNLCMNCMNELYGETQCPRCGYSAETPQVAPYLALKTPIGDKYIIGKAISANNEGVSYMAYDIERRSPVVIREFLPEKLIERQPGETKVSIREPYAQLYYNLLKNFLDLWRNLSRIRGFSALIPVIDVVEDNNTAYAVMEHIESLSLREFLLRSKTGYLKWEKARQIFMPVLSLLSTLHKMGIYHYGISPDTLLIGRDGKLRLSGFSITPVRFEGNVLPAEIYEGFTPIEQYGYKLESGSWSDVYSFCAVVYRSLVGSVPQDAVSRSSNDMLIIPARYAEIIPVYVINALMNGMQVDPNERTRDIETLRDEFSATPSNVVSSYSSVSVPAEEKEQPEEAPPPVIVVDDENSTVRTILKTFLIIVGVGLIAFAGWFIYDRVSKAPKEEEKESVTNLEDVVEVPNFVNNSYDMIAQNPVHNENYKIESVMEYSSTVAKGYIISQSIEPGESVEKGTKLVFTVSKGPEYKTIPEVIGLDGEIAKAQLEEMGFVVKVIEKTNDGNNDVNSVAGVSPGEGTSVIKGGEVQLEVWGEPTYIIPDFNGDLDIGDLISGILG